MFRLYKLKNYNFRLVILLAAISSMGVMLVGSAMKSLQMRQLGGVLLGATVMVVVSLIDFSWILNFSWILYGINLILLLAVVIMGNDAKGATRWLKIGPIQFQPTELSKILLIIFFAKFLMDHENDLNKPKTILKATGLLAVPLSMILIQPDLKNTITIALLFCVLMYLAGLSYKIIGGILLAAVPLAAVFLLIVVQPDQKLLKDYQRNRIMAFLYPGDEEYSDDTMQQDNSIMAIGSGKLTGKGYNNSKVSSVNKANFVSEIQTDFIFAVAGEELGFVGASAIILLLFAISVECLLTSRRAKDLSGRLICCGVGTLVAFQSFLNICVATGLTPNTGTPLPFVSYGLSSLVSLFIGMGLVLNVGLQNRNYFVGEKHEHRINRTRF